MTAPPTKESPRTRARVLVVEDSSVFREMQGLLLRQAGYAVSLHENPLPALEVAAKEHFDLVVIDYELPGMNGEQFMHELRKIQPDIAVVFVSGSLTVDLAIKLSSQGVAGIFNKPTNPKTLLEKINETLARNAARDTAARVGSGSPLSPTRRGTQSPFSITTEPTADRTAYRPRFLLGKSDPFREFTHRLWKVRDFRAVLLLQGEAGSPFELIAREMAEISIFRDGPIMVCDAAQFEPKRLIEVLAPSLLSHDAGTLVVTGVETFNASQQKTLENLMTGRDVFLPFARRFRLILAASNALTERVDEGSFGETLFYKVSSLTVSVPSLREMRTDIVANAKRILAWHREAGHPQAPVEIAADAAEWLEAQDWPGNYDQLARTLLSAATLAEGHELTLNTLAAGGPAAQGASAATSSVTQPLAAADGDDHGPAVVRPPFPIASALAAQSGASQPPMPATSAAVAASPVTTTATPGAIARAPAGQLFARPAGRAKVLTAQSLFRPASSTYSFTKRLADSLEVADTCGTH